MAKRVSALLVAAAMIVSSVAVIPGLSSPLQRAYAQSPPVCPSNEILKMTMAVPPNNVNALIISVESGFILSYLEFRDVYGMGLANGNPWPPGIIDTVSSNSNYTVWTFNVKPGLKWSDGTTATAQDILTTYGPTFALNATYDFANIAPEIKSEYALNTSAAVYVLNAPDAHWPERMSFLYFSPIYPASEINKEGPSGNMFGAPSLGPFYIYNYNPSSFQMVMYRNPYYQPLPRICEVSINFVDSYSATATYLISGTVDLAPVDTRNIASILKANQYARLYTAPNEGWQSINWNDTIFPYNMTAFRQAIAYGINDSLIVTQSFAGYATPAFSAEGGVPPSSTKWYNPNVKQYDFDQTKSLELLNSIGITKGSDGFLHYRNGTIATLHLLTDSDYAWDVQTASIVQSNLQQIGFKISPVVTSTSNMIADYESNVGDARSSMMVYTHPALYEAPFLLNLAGWLTYSPVATTPHTWLYPPSANTQYEGNFSAFLATANPTLVHDYTFNIQALNAEYLGGLVLAYPGFPWIANTQHWTNWPSGPYGIMPAPDELNETALATLAPINATSQTSSSSTVIATSTSSTVASTSGSSASGLGSSVWIILSGVVIVIVAASAVLWLRRRPRSKAQISEAK